MLISGKKESTLKKRTQCRHCAGPVRQFNIAFHAEFETLKPSLGPIHRHGLRELPSIPNEIYLEIMSYLKPSNSPSSDSSSLTQDMARICRFFCSIALPWIFESFFLVIGRDETGSGPENRTKFCRRLLNGEEAVQTATRCIMKCTVFVVGMMQRHWMGTTGTFVDVLQGHSPHAEYRGNRTFVRNHQERHIEVLG